MPALAEGAIEPATDVEGLQVSVQTSALVDVFGAMYYVVHKDSVDFYFGASNDDHIHIGFTDQSMVNFARLVNQAVCATLRARGIPVPAYVGHEQGGVEKP